MSSIPQATSLGAAPPAARIASPRKSRVRVVALRWGLAVLATVGIATAAWRLDHAQSAPSIRYQTAPADRGPLEAKVTASGTVSAIVTVQVGSQVSGRIQGWYADFNAKVKSGQLIAQIEPSLFAAAVEQARASYAAAKAGYDKSIANRSLAERNYARDLALFEQNIAARSDLDAAEAAAGAARADVESANASMKLARAALDQALLNLSYTRIVSPIDGIVISRNIDLGQTVAASFQAPTLFTIAQDLTKMQVDTNVAEGDVGKVREGMTAMFVVDAFPNREFRGVVRQVRDNATTLQNVVTYDAVIDVDNVDLTLRPTMTANVTFVYAAVRDALRVPNAALRFKPDEATAAAMLGIYVAGSAAVAPKDALAVDHRLVWVRSGSTTAARVLRIGISDGMMTEVLDGDVRPGEGLVTEAIVTSAGNKGP